MIFTDHMDEMNKTIDEKIASIVERHERLLGVLTSIPELPDPVEWHVDIDGDLAISYPLDKNLLFQLRDIMIDAGWVCWSEPDLSTSAPHMAFAQSKAWYSVPCVYIRFYSYFEGATCVAKKIGVETIEKPIYEIVCKEGATEEL